MNLKWVTDRNILFYIFWLVLQTSLGNGCTFHGINCISCTDYQKCNDGYPEGRVISCKIGDICADNYLRQCQMKLNCYALNECTQTGIFPDAMIDSKYYVCLNDASSGFLKYEFTCPEGNFFDKASLTCAPRDVTLPTTEISSSSSASTNPSFPSSSTTPASSSMVTDSTSLSPLTSTEPVSSTSFTSSATATNPITSTSISSTSSSTSMSSAFPSTISTTTIPGPTTTPFACMASGIFPNPGNCKMYYRCSTSLKAFFYICPGNSYFNENILKCSMIITPACQEQILKNLTTTGPPQTPTDNTATTSTLELVTTSSTSTTTPAPIATSPSTTTIMTTYASTTIKMTIPASTTTAMTTPALSTTTTQYPETTTTARFSCQVTGVFANPLDCKTYYRCALSGNIFQYVCPGNTYFNEFTKRCSLIITPRCKDLIQG